MKNSPPADEPVSSLVRRIVDDVDKLRGLLAQEHPTLPLPSGLVENDETDSPLYKLEDNYWLSDAALAAVVILAAGFSEGCDASSPSYSLREGIKQITSLLTRWAATVPEDSRGFKFVRSPLERLAECAE